MQTAAQNNMSDIIALNSSQIILRGHASSPGIQLSNIPAATFGTFRSPLSNGTITTIRQQHSRIAPLHSSAVRPSAGKTAMARIVSQSSASAASKAPFIPQIPQSALYSSAEDSYLSRQANNSLETLPMLIANTPPNPVRSNDLIRSDLRRKIPASGRSKSPGPGINSIPRMSDNAPSEPLPQAQEMPAIVSKNNNSKAYTFESFDLSDPDFDFLPDESISAGKSLPLTNTTTKLSPALNETLSSNSNFEDHLVDLGVGPNAEEPRNPRRSKAQPHPASSRPNALLFSDSTRAVPPKPRDSPKLQPPQTQSGRLYESQLLKNISAPQADGFAFNFSRFTRPGEGSRNRLISLTGGLASNPRRSVTPTEEGKAANHSESPTPDQRENNTHLQLPKKISGGNLINRIKTPPLKEALSISKQKEQQNDIFIDDDSIFDENPFDREVNARENLEEVQARKGKNSSPSPQPDLISSVHSPSPNKQYDDSEEEEIFALVGPSKIAPFREVVPRVLEKHTTSDKSSSDDEYDTNAEPCNTPDARVVSSKPGIRRRTLAQLNKDRLRTNNDSQGVSSTPGVTIEHFEGNLSTKDDIQPSKDVGTVIDESPIRPPSGGGLALKPLRPQKPRRKRFTSNSTIPDSISKKQSKTIPDSSGQKTTVDDTVEDTHRDASSDFEVYDKPPSAQENCIEKSIDATSSPPITVSPELGSYGNFTASRNKSSGLGYGGLAISSRRVSTELGCDGMLSPLRKQGSGIDIESSPPLQKTSPEFGGDFDFILPSRKTGSEVDLGVSDPVTLTSRKTSPIVQIDSTSEDALTAEVLESSPPPEPRPADQDLPQSDADFSEMRPPVNKLKRFESPRTSPYVPIGVAAERSDSAQDLSMELSQAIDNVEVSLSQQNSLIHNNSSAIPLENTKVGSLNTTTSNAILPTFFNISSALVFQSRKKMPAYKNPLTGVKNGGNRPPPEGKNGENEEGGFSRKRRRPNGASPVPVSGNGANSAQPLRDQRVGVGKNYRTPLLGAPRAPQHNKTQKPPAIIMEFGPWTPETLELFEWRPPNLSYS